MRQGRGSQGKEERTAGSRCHGQLSPGTSPHPPTIPLLPWMKPALDSPGVYFLALSCCFSAICFALKLGFLSSFLFHLPHRCPPVAFSDPRAWLHCHLHPAAKHASLTWANVVEEAAQRCLFSLCSLWWKDKYQSRQGKQTHCT